MRKFNQPALPSCAANLLCFAVALLAPAMNGQSKPAAGPFVPPPDPGYTLYYHDTGEPNVGARWGYHDGWTDGRHDRSRGEDAMAQDKEQYKMPPEHGGHPGITREAYMRIYREAYQKGYQHGSRI